MKALSGKEYPDGSRLLKEVGFFLVGWEKGKQAFVSWLELRTLLGRKLSAPSLSPGHCCFLGPKYLLQVPPAWPQRPGEGEIRMTAAGPWAGGRQGGDGGRGVSLEEGQRAGA